MQNNRLMWIIVLSSVLFFGVAVVTLRAAERAVHPGASAAVHSGPASAVAPGKQPATAHTVLPERQHPPASAPEESATIADDPTTAPDAAQSADNNVSFPTNI
jgi:hypothetical protein